MLWWWNTSIISTSALHGLKIALKFKTKTKKKIPETSFVIVLSQLTFEQPHSAQPFLFVSFGSTPPSSTSFLIIASALSTFLPPLPCLCLLNSVTVTLMSTSDTSFSPWLWLGAGPLTLPQLHNARGQLNRQANKRTNTPVKRRLY